MPGGEGVPPDRAPDGKAGVTGNRSTGAQPTVDPGVIGAPPQNHAPHPATVVGTRHAGNGVAIGRGIHSLDLPDVRLDPRSANLADHVEHESRPYLRVVHSRISTCEGSLWLRGGHQQLEQELPIGLVQPVAQQPEACPLEFLHLDVVVGVPAHEHLGERGGKCRNVVSKVFSVFEVEHVLTRAFDRGRRRYAEFDRLPENRSPHLLVDEDASSLGEAG